MLAQISNPKIAFFRILVVKSTKHAFRSRVISSPLFHRAILFSHNACGKGIVYNRIKSHGRAQNMRRPSKRHLLATLSLALCFPWTPSSWRAEPAGGPVSRGAVLAHADLRSVDREWTRAKLEAFIALFTHTTTFQHTNAS